MASRDGDRSVVYAVDMGVPQHPFILNGQRVAAGKLEPLHAPEDGREIAQVWTGDRSHAEEALREASLAFETTRKMPAHRRQQVLARVSAAIKENGESLAQTIAVEAGKPIRAARAEVERAIFTFQVAAEEATRIAGETLPMDVQPSGEGRVAWVKRFPLGVVAAITPFNFPLNLVAHKVAPAIAAGCTMVLKPAPQTPLSALRLAEMVHQAGWPFGALNVVPLSNEDAQALTASDVPKLVSFTGSARVGWELKAKAGKKRVVLELGGNAAVIIHRDADLHEAAVRCLIGGFTYSGQSCISVQRILVERTRYAEFLDGFIPLVKQLKVGKPLDETTDVGPMIRESDAIRCEQWISEAVAENAQVLAGGRREGVYLQPTVLVHTKPRQKVNCEEIFAPLVTVESYETLEEAIERANATQYGLQAGIFTHDSRAIFEAFEKIEVGGLMVNEVPTFRLDHMPYGGVKDSGLGREGVRYAIEEMTEPKLLVMKP